MMMMMMMMMIIIIIIIIIIITISHRQLGSSMLPEMSGNCRRQDVCV